LTRKIVELGEISKKRRELRSGLKGGFPDAKKRKKGGANTEISSSSRKKAIDGGRKIMKNRTEGTRGRS